MSAKKRTIVSVLLLLSLLLSLFGAAAEGFGGGVPMGESPSDQVFLIGEEDADPQALTGGEEVLQKGTARSLFIGTDRHDNTFTPNTGRVPTLLKTANNWLSQNRNGGIEAVCFGGDNVAGPAGGTNTGPKNGDTTFQYSTSQIDAEVLSVLTGLTASDIYYTYGSHDGRATDIDTAFLGRGSCEHDVERSDYYLYGLDYMDVVDYRTGSKSAQQFLNWAKNANPSKPVILVCHVPLHAARGDQTAAQLWVNTLNQANDEYGLDLIFVFGHNHTNEGMSAVYYEKGSTLNVQKDNTNGADEWNSGSKNGVNMQIRFTYLSGGYMVASKSDPQCTTYTVDTANKKLYIDRFNLSGHMNTKTVTLTGGGSQPPSGKTYSVSVNNPANGTVQLSATSAEAGTNVTLTVNAASGYELDTLTDNGADVKGQVTNGIYTIRSIGTDHTLNVSFKRSPVTYTLSVNSPTGGTAVLSALSVTEGSSVTLTLTPASGYELDSVKDGSTDVTSSVRNNVYTLSNIRANHSFTVAFKKTVVYYTVSVNSPTNGTARLSATSAEAGSNVTLTLSASSGYELDTLTDNGNNVKGQVTNGVYTIRSIGANHTLNVTFKKTPVTTYSITVNSPSNGTVRLSATSAEAGTNVTLTVNAASGYELDTLTDNGADVKGQVTNGIYTIRSIGANHTLNVTFKRSTVTYTLSVNSPANGTAVLSALMVTEGSSVTLTLTPAAGYELEYLRDGTSDVTSRVRNNVYTLSDVRADHSFTAAFKKAVVNYTVRVNSPSNGTARLSATNAEAGTNVTLTLTSASGYELDTLRDNGTDVTAQVTNGIYTIRSISADHSLTVSFRAKTAQTCVVTFHTDGGTSIVTIAVGQTPGKPADPDPVPATGVNAAFSWTFENWYSDESFTTLFDFGKAVSRNTDVYARYCYKTYMGDLDRNGKVNGNDAAIILQTRARLYTPDEYQSQVADLSGNGSVGSEDATYVLQIAARMLESRPVTLYKK